MRNTAETLHEFEATVDRYLIKLDNLEMEQLLRKTDEDEWSIGQMYMHLIQSAQFMQLNNVDQCLAGNEATVVVSGIKTEQGREVFELGSFPPVRPCPGFAAIHPAATGEQGAACGRSPKCSGKDETYRVCLESGV